MIRAEGLPEPDFDNGRIHTFADEKLSLSLQKPNAARRILKSFHRFIVVRNPWLRIASGYLDKFVREPINMQNAHVIEQIKAHHGHTVSREQEYIWKTMGLEIPLMLDPEIDYEHGVTFREFVDYLCAEEDNRLDVHWRPQFRFSGKRGFDRVIRLEDVGPGLATLAKDLAISNVEIPHLHRNSATVPTKESLSDVPAIQLRARQQPLHAANLYASDLIRQVGDRFARDAGTFGFDIPKELR